jgi:hypothetical protein
MEQYRNNHGAKEGYPDNEGFVPHKIPLASQVRIRT